MQVQLGSHKLPAFETTPPPNMADPPTDHNTASDPAVNDVPAYDAAGTLMLQDACAPAHKS
jgi:hypothetical protein